MGSMKLRSDMQCIAAVESGMSETCNMRIYIRDAGPLFEDDEFQGLIDMKISSSEELGDVEGVIVQLTGDIVSFRPGTNIHMHSSFGAVRIAFDREHLPVQGQGQREGTMRLKAGTHTLPFKIPVPAGIPPSYFYNNSGDGIHYSIKAVVLRPTKNKKMRQALQFATKAAAKAAFGKEAGYNFSDISDDVVAEPSALEVYNVTVAGERRWDAGTPVPARVMQVTAPHVSSWCTKVGQPIVYMAAAASIGGAEVIVDDEDPDRTKHKIRMPVAVSCGVVPEGAATPAHGARAGLTSKLRLVNSRTGKVHAATVVHPDDKAGPAWINPAKKDMQGAPDPGIIFLEVDVAGMTPSFGTSEDTGGHENRYELVYTIGGGCGGVSVSMPLEVRLSDMPLPTREPLLQAIAGAVPGQIVKVPLQSASAAGQGAAGAAPSLSLRMAEELPGRTA